MVNIFSAPVVELSELNNFFIELTEKNCNQKCKHCYIDFPISRAPKDFISLDKIKMAISDTKTENINCIYLTGAEPMMHPDFNTILRLCLQRSNVCICTNSSFINEKKARFLKKVEDESRNEIIFKLSIDHYDEIKNDDLRGRGSYRQVVNAIKNLVKYNFNPVLNIVNYYNEDRKILLTEFKNLCDKIGYETNDWNFCISEYYNKYKNSKNSEKIEGLMTDFEANNLDCQNGRILTEKGVYVCPFLANDHRGWMGSDFKNYSKKMYLETDFCQTCTKNKGQMCGLCFSKTT